MVSTPADELGMAGGAVLELAVPDVVAGNAIRALGAAAAAVHATVLVAALTVNPAETNSVDCVASLTRVRISTLAVDPVRTPAVRLLKAMVVLAVVVPDDGEAFV